MILFWRRTIHYGTILCVVLIGLVCFCEGGVSNHVKSDRIRREFEKQSRPQPSYFTAADISPPHLKTNSQGKDVGASSTIIPYVRRGEKGILNFQFCSSAINFWYINSVTGL